MTYITKHLSKPPSLSHATSLLPSPPLFPSLLLSLPQSLGKNCKEFSKGLKCCVSSTVVYMIWTEYLFRNGGRVFISPYLRDYAVVLFCDKIAVFFG